MDLPSIGPAGPARTATAATPDPEADKRARDAAEAFEAAFLGEMLKYTGVNAMPDSFGGGAGEEAFGSFLTQEYARLIAERGGIGIAEQVFETLKQRMQGQ